MLGEFISSPKKKSLLKELFLFEVIFDDLEPLKFLLQFRPLKPHF